MQMTIQKQIGKQVLTFIVEGKNLFELQMTAQKLGFPNVYKCGKCQSDKLYLHAYITKEESYEYIKIACGECKASLTFGRQKKEPDTFFLRKTESGELDWQEFKGESK